MVCFENVRLSPCDPFANIISPFSFPSAIQFTVDKEALAAEEAKKNGVLASKENTLTPGRSPARFKAEPLVKSSALGQAEEEEECLNCGA